MMFDALFHQSRTIQIEMGSVGWEDDDEHAFRGEGTEDGHTLVKVQLFRGRDRNRPLSETRAQGYQIVCHISGGLFRIPKKDTRVFVAIPEGMEHVPGAGVIFATVEPSPHTQLQTDRAVMDFGDDVHVIVKGKSITLQDPEHRFLAVGTPRSGGTPGVQIHLPDGTGAAWQDSAVAIFSQAGTLMQMTPEKFEVWQGGMFMKLGESEFWTLAPVCKVQGGVFLGRAPTAANTAIWGPTGVAGAASPSVWLSAI